jgi:hypothetical protein
MHQSTIKRPAIHRGVSWPKLVFWNMGISYFGEVMEESKIEKGREHAISDLLNLSSWLISLPLVIGPFISYTS